MAMKSGIPGSMRRRVFREGAYTCSICGLTGKESKQRNGAYSHPTHIPDVWLSIDHIVPKSQGGSHDRCNLRVLCTSCNTKKGVKDA